MTSSSSPQCFSALFLHPLYALSRSSTELFHSNFWVWLFTYDKRFIHIFFPDLNLDKLTIDCIKREQDHRDITIWSEGKAYVIENKLKASADQTQLLKYQKKLKKKFGSGVITGIDGQDIGDWRFVSYNNIGKQLEEIITPRNDNNQFNHLLIAEYATFIQQLSQMITEEFNQSSGKLIISDKYCSKKVVETGYSDLVKKMSVARLKDHVICALADSLGNITIDHGFSNKKPILGLYYTFTVNNIPYRIGIQIEGNQYRHYFEIFGNMSIASLYQIGVEAGWLCEKNGNQWNGRNTGMKNQYCKYETDKSKFVYQYWMLDDCDLSFDNITKYLQSDLPMAQNCINRIREILDH